MYKHVSAKGANFLAMRNREAIVYSLSVALSGEVIFVAVSDG